MLDNYRHTLRICNTCCCSTATMVTWTRLNRTLMCIGWLNDYSLLPLPPWSRVLSSFRFTIRSYISRNIRRLWNPNVHYRVDNSSVLVDVLSHVVLNRAVVLCVCLRSILTLFSNLHQAYKGTRTIMSLRSLIYPLMLAVSNRSVNHLYRLL